MIAKRYGKRIQSVTPDFNPVAMNEIGFRRDDVWNEETATFAEQYEKMHEHQLTAADEGDVQSEAEARLLNTLLTDLQAIESNAAPGDMLVIENEAGTDYPRLHSTQRTVVVGFENRLYFTYSVDPALRVGVYRRKQA